MTAYNKIRGTTEQYFQIQKGGAQWKNDSQVLIARNAADGAFAVVRAASPVGGDDVVTKTYLAMARQYYSITVATSSLDTTIALPDDQYIQEVYVVIGTSYSAGATMAITRKGDGTVAPLAVGDVNLEATAGTIYAVPQHTSWGSTGDGYVSVTIGGAPGAGACTVIIGMIDPLDIT